MYSKSLLQRGTEGTLTLKLPKGHALAREITLLFHFIGFGLLMTINVAGFFIGRQYAKVPDLQSKATLLRAMRPIGLLSPVGIVVMLITGIGNMHALGFSIMELPGWLAYKIVFFALAIISGTIFGIKAAKRGKLVGKMLANQAPPDAEAQLKSLDSQMSWSNIVMPVLLLIILWLSIYGRLGGQ